MRRTAIVLAACAFVGQSLDAQPAPPLDQLLDRMGEYLIDYESQLSSVVAEERFEQRIVGRIMTGRWRHLESDIAFMRLPGGAEWLGFRDVRNVNGKPVGTTGPTIAEVLGSESGDLKKALAIANASARHNLGLPRTVNVPTAPLDIIHPRYRDVHKFDRRGTDTVEGTLTTIIGFEEVTRPTLVREPSGINLVSSGRIWLEPANGRIWRVEWFYQDEKGRNDGWRPPRLRVEFEPHKELGFMVPVRMTEDFTVPRARGEGKAVYRNFRRFGTSARIVPQ
jgi:hypothetical protein